MASIQTRKTKSGKSYSVIWDEPTATGDRKQRRKTFKRRKDAEAYRVEIEHQLQNGAYIAPTKLTVAEHVERWLTTIEPTVKPSTHDRYRRVAENNIIPSLGALALTKLSPVHVQDFYAGERAKGLSPSTVALYHGILHRCLDAAVKRRLIPYNPCKAVDAPRARNPEMRTWTAEDARRFLEVAEHDDLYAFWRLALVTAARRGELLALRWADCDLGAGVIRIRRTLSRGRDGVVFGEPKTAAGNRAVELDHATVDVLWRHKREQNARRLELGAGWIDDDLVFERGDGRYLHPNIVSYRFPKLCEAAEVPRIRLHDARHTSITLMLANGESPRVVQQRVGHSDISMTLGRYGHVLPGQDREAADRLARLLRS